QKVERVLSRHDHQVCLRESRSQRRRRAGPLAASAGLADRRSGVQFVWCHGDALMSLNSQEFRILRETRESEFLRLSYTMPREVSSLYAVCCCMVWRTTAATSSATLSMLRSFPLRSTS